jgi:transcriptional regulator with XRE-family HTH domain
MNRQQIKLSTERIKQFHQWREWAETICREDGPELIEAATATISLRELGRKTGLSSTYLSFVKTGKKTISTAAFLKIANELS